MYFRDFQMRSLHWTRRCYQSSQLPCAITSSRKLLSLRVQRHASRQSSPGFSASGPANPRPFKGKSPAFDGSKPSESPHKSVKEDTSAKPSSNNILNRLRIRPGKIILFSILGYLGYKVYTWQTDPYRSLILNSKFFTPFILEKREKVSSTSAILNLLSVPPGQNTENVTEAWKTGVWSVQVMQPELQIARSYSPLPPPEDAEPEQLRLFVRREPQGEVSTFLHKINRGTLVHLRGPHLEYEIPQDVDDVLFIAGGTGIAPALQLAHTLFKHRISSLEDGPRLRILWANRRREDSYKGLKSQHSQKTVIPRLRGLAARWQGSAGPQSKEAQEDVPAPTTQPQTALVEEVESLKIKYAGKVNIDYFVDEDNSYITETVLRNHLTSIEHSLEQTAEDQPTRKRVILISGPEGFVNFYAGPKFMKGGKEVQGPLRGILGKIDLRGWDVWKL